MRAGWAALVLFATFGCSQAPEDLGAPANYVEYLQSWGSEKNQRALTMLVREDGTTYIVGSFAKNLHLGNYSLQAQGPQDLFWAQLSPDGDTLHAQSIPLARGSISALRAALHPQGGFCLGGSISGSGIDFGDGPISEREEKDIFLSCYDAEHRASTRLLEGPGDQVLNAIQISAEGQIYLAGRFEESINYLGQQLGLSQKDEDAFILRLDGDSLSWFKTISSSGFATASALTQTSQGALVLAGLFDQKLSFEGTELISKGGTDIFLLGFDSLGQLLFSSSYGDEQSGQEVTGLAPAPQGGIYMAGTFRGELAFSEQVIRSRGRTDLFVTYLSPDLVPNYVLRLGDSSSDLLRQIHSDHRGNLWLVGNFEGNLSIGEQNLWSAGGRDLFLAKLAPTGEALFGMRFGDNDPNQFGAAVGTDGSGAAYLWASYSGTIEADQMAVSSQGDLDLLLLKLRL